ncbi:alpha/beta fold hydrolase [Flavihumibacter petaseus]|uniref:Putative hydrolase n=1 Tax=Flavihumibacter petaseus NBRC 106054 TaxID=1220578 RepID=A0A0E9N711_9BACT|nr:alpha/beta hydrolase [Flavihumibacter petaseus]GAO45588.1 putative hydrolase [Flavihumibacter petaseus NBRC 106054]
MMQYNAIGDGQPLMLVHGFGEDYRIWDEQVPVLAEKFRVITPQLPGTGNTPAESSPTMESMADGLKEILDHEKIPRIILVGHSMGGYISLAFAEKYPQHLRALGLFHSTALADNEQKKETRRKGIAFIRQHGAEAFLQSTTQNLFAEKNRETMAASIKAIARDNSYISDDTLVAFYEAMIARPDRTAVLKNSAVPVLFILGRYDQAISFEDTLKLVHLPEITYIHILEASGHMGMLEETRKANQYLKDFAEQV